MRRHQKMNLSSVHLANSVSFHLVLTLFPLTHFLICTANAALFQSTRLVLCLSLSYSETPSNNFNLTGFHPCFLLFSHLGCCWLSSQTSSQLLQGKKKKEQGQKQGQVPFLCSFSSTDLCQLTLAVEMQPQPLLLPMQTHWQQLRFQEMLMEVPAIK